MKKTSQEETKLHNKRLIMRTIYEAGTISRAEVARITKLTPTTVSDLVEDLMKDKLVIEAGTGVSIGGKPPTLITIPDDSRLTIGIDLSDYELHGAVVNLRGEIKYGKSVKCDRTGEEAIDVIKSLIADLLKHVDPSLVLGIGLGSPGVVSIKEGVVRRAVKYHWSEVQLRKILQAEFNVPVVVANDSQVAALAEYIFGLDPSENNLVLMKVGEGISAGLIIDGEIFDGDGHGAGEIGHICVEPNGILCRCGHSGCLETVASLRAISQMTHEVFPEVSFQTFEESMPILFEAIKNNNSESIQIINRVGEYLGLAIANIVGLLNIHKIVLAGPVSSFGHHLISPIKSSMEKKTLDALSDQTQISISTLGNNIVQIGAAALVQQTILGLF